MVLYASSEFQPKTSLKEAGEMVDELGPSATGELLAELIRAAYPELNIDDSAGEGLEATAG